MDATRDDRLGDLFAAALSTGMRQGELLGLRWPDVDLEAGTIRVRQAVQKIDGEWQFVEPKSANGRRTIPLCEPAVDALRRQKEQVRAMRAQADTVWQEWGLVFPSAVGTPQDSSNVTYHLQRRLEAAGLPRAPSTRCAIRAAPCSITRACRLARSWRSSATRRSRSRSAPIVTPQTPCSTRQQAHWRARSADGADHIPVSETEINRLS